MFHVVKRQPGLINVDWGVLAIALLVLWFLFGRFVGL
jgi:hypothetical protein